MTTKPLPKSQSQSQSDIVAELKKLGFSDIRAETPRRLVASVSGKEKTGKTHFCLTAPGPIAFFNIDLGTEGVVEKFQDGFNEQPPKQILICDIRVPKGANKDVYASMWADLKQKVEAAYKLREGSVVIDTCSEAYELCRLAHFGKLTQVLPHNYAVVNNDWREFMRLAYDSPISTLLIHKVKPKYVDNVRTREYEIAGMSEIPYLVQVNISTFRETTEDGQLFGITVTDCRQNPELCGTSLRGYPMSTFDFLLGLVYGS